MGHKTEPNVMTRGRIQVGRRGVDRGGRIYRGLGDEGSWSALCMCVGIVGIWGDDTRDEEPVQV